MTGIYDDRILAFTGEWVNTNEICRLVKGDNSKIKGEKGALRELVDSGYLETKTDGYIIQYRRIDKAVSNNQFDVIMATFELNKETLLDEMKRLDYSIATELGILTREGEELLDFIQTELLDRSFMLMTRVKYQQTLKMLPYSVGNKRVYRIQKFVDGVLEELKVLKNEKLIMERFQNHTHKLQPFKV